MITIKMLGTGAGFNFDYYNTCFVIQNALGNFLVDTGGSADIVRRLSNMNISLSDITDVFISHSHIDHVLGLIWMFKGLYGIYASGKKQDKIHIYCNDVVYDTIFKVTKSVLSKKILDYLFEHIEFKILQNDDVYVIHGITYQFFDILARGTKQFGFECNLDNNRFIFLGDETLNPLLNGRICGADYVTHEAFCLDKEENIFHAYEKNHSTVLSAAKTMNELDVKNLILYHTEESHGRERKKLYIEEAKSVFDGNVMVPDDMEEIVLTRK